MLLLLITAPTKAISIDSLPLFDLRDLKPELVVPPIESGETAPGKRVIQQLPSYQKTEVYHLLYLPVNWQAGKKYPIIVEYPGNGPWEGKYGDISTGKVDACNLGYGISGGLDFIWISMPFISQDGQKNQDWWWGDVEACKAYCLKTIKLVCQEYGGDMNAIILSGFSRGAIAANYIGLHDDEIAKLWTAFVVNTHYDGLRQWGYANDDQEAAKRRLSRLAGRPQFICAEGGGTTKTRAYLEQTGIKGNFTFVDLPFRNHVNTWILFDLPERKHLQDWLASTLHK